MAKMCFQRPTNIVVVTSDEEDVMNSNKKCEVFTTLDEIGFTKIKNYNEEGCFKTNG